MNRAQLCAEFLDKRFNGWRDHVDTSNLDLASIDDCVLAQVGKKMFDLPEQSAVYSAMLDKIYSVCKENADDMFVYWDALSNGFADNADLADWLKVLA